jgi:acetyl-CoA carboxylase biotin carboxyl carrier protein
MDEKQITNLMARFEASNIVELQLSNNGFSLCLRKREAFGGNGTATGASPAPAAATGNAPRSQAGKGDLITAPIVATFYASANPDTPAFVSVGSRVKTGDTLCILEAMKQMNHMEAEYDCEILEVHAKSGDFVEFGQPLFTVKKL